MRRAFTLVEMLVVIGIIGILLAILLPALNTVRDRANTTKCAANLRSLGQGAVLYLQNYKGFYPAGRLPKIAENPDDIRNSLDGEYRPRWYELVGREVKIYPNMKPSTKDLGSDSWLIENSMFLCPSVPEWTNCRNYPYGYNHQFLGNARKKPSATATGGQWTWVNWPVSTTVIKRPDKTVMAADCMGTAAGQSRKKRHGYVLDGDPKFRDVHALGNKGYLIDPPRLTANSDYSDPERRDPENRAGPDSRHANRTKLNVLFCDGHVDLLAAEDMGYRINSDGSIGVNGDNSLWSGKQEDLDPPPYQ